MREKTALIGDDWPSISTMLVNVCNLRGLLPEYKTIRSIALLMTVCIPDLNSALSLNGRRAPKVGTLTSDVTKY